MWCWGGSLLAESVCELAAQSLVVLGEFSVARVGGLQLAQQRGVCGALPCGHRCLRCLAAEIAEALDLGPDAGLDVKPGSRHVRPAGDSFQRHQGAGGVQLARPSLRLSAARVTVRVAVRSSRPSAPSRARRQWRLRPSLGRSVSPPRPWSAPRSAWPADGRHAVIPRAGCGGRSPRPHGPRPARPKRCGNSWAGCCAATPRPGVAGCCAATPRPGGRPPDWPSKWSPPPTECGSDCGYHPPTRRPERAGGRGHARRPDHPRLRPGMAYDRGVGGRADTAPRGLGASPGPDRARPARPHRPHPRRRRRAGTGPRRRRSGTRGPRGGSPAVHRAAPGARPKNPGSASVANVATCAPREEKAGRRARGSRRRPMPCRPPTPARTARRCRYGRPARRWSRVRPRRGSGTQPVAECCERDGGSGGGFGENAGLTLT